MKKKKTHKTVQEGGAQPLDVNFQKEDTVDVSVRGRKKAGKKRAHFWVVLHGLQCKQRVTEKTVLYRRKRAPPTPKWEVNERGSVQKLEKGKRESELKLTVISKKDSSTWCKGTGVLRNTMNKRDWAKKLNDSGNLATRDQTHPNSPKTTRDDQQTDLGEKHGCQEVDHCRIETNAQVMVGKKKRAKTRRKRFLV